MSEKNSNLEVGDGSSSRALSKLSDLEGIRISVDLVSAARRLLSFLRGVAYSSWLLQTPNIVEAIRRYEELWMPLIFGLSEGLSKQLMIWPPFDIEWVWLCHCLHPQNYRQYCQSRFGKLLEKPAIFDDENEEYALIRCSEIWVVRYPSEPFDIKPISDASEKNISNSNVNVILLEMVSRCGCLCSKFSEPFMSETVYLIASKYRYRRFLNVLETFRDEYNRLMPTSDIHLMWLTHRSFPCRYEEDVKELKGDLERVVGVLEIAKKEEVQETKTLWEKTFEEPYERAGATFDWIFTGKLPICWDVLDADVNKKYKGLEPRFLLEVCIFVKGKWAGDNAEDSKGTFLRLRLARSHRELKIDMPMCDIVSESWRKTFHLFCEFGTRGIVLELRQRGGCLGRSKRIKRIVFSWIELLRASSQTLAREVKQSLEALASITPPVQAPYLLKCVPDRVTDDSGAMISDVILRTNQYRPQEGRWLSRTVLDHVGRECFVIRIRVGGGFWRRGAETPAAVKWVDRIIEIREGSWSYFAGSIGTAPEKIVGMATPKEEDSRQKKATWCLSTGHVLTIRWEDGFRFELENCGEQDESRATLLSGRKMQYQAREEHTESKEDDNNEDGFVTLMRSTPENPNGRATALLNWRLFAAEFFPEEDAVLVLLLCTAIIRTISEVWRDDVGRLLVRRREKEAKLGSRDWGSVMLHPCSSSTSTSIHLRPWYWNAKDVLTSTEADYSRQTNNNYSPAEGGEGLYKRGIMP